MLLLLGGAAAPAARQEGRAAAAAAGAYKSQGGRGGGPAQRGPAHIVARHGAGTPTLARLPFLVPPRDCFSLVNLIPAAGEAPS